MSKQPAALAYPSSRLTQRWGPYLLSVAVLAIVLAAALPIGNASPLGFDEAYNLNLARTLAQEGVYATRLAGEGLRFFDPDVSTGPALLVPYAAELRALGTSLTLVRALAVAGLLGSLLAAGWTAGLVGGCWAAPLFMALLAGTPLVILTGVWAQGDVPALGLAFAGIGLYEWGTRVEAVRRRATLFLASGLALGLAVLTKDVLMLLVLAGLLSAGWEIVIQRRSEARLHLLPGLMGALTFLAWRVTPFLYLAVGSRREALATWRAQAASRAALMRQVVIFDPFSHPIPALQAAWTTFGPLLVAAGLLVAATWLAPDKMTLRWGNFTNSPARRWLTAAVFVWLGWYFLLSGVQANHRHLLPGIVMLELLLVTVAARAWSASRGPRALVARRGQSLALAVCIGLAAFSGWNALSHYRQSTQHNKAWQLEAAAWIQAHTSRDEPLYGWGWFVPWHLAFLGEREPGRITPWDPQPGLGGWFVVIPELASTGNFDQQVQDYLATLGEPQYTNPHYQIYQLAPERAD